MSIPIWLASISGAITLSPQIFNWLSLAAALCSAGAWFYASRVKVSSEEAFEITRRNAEKRGGTPNYAGMSFDGWDFRETLAAQARWSAIGAFLAAVAVAGQAIAQLL